MKKVYQSNIEPKDTNVVWINPETSEIKTFINGSWRTLTASSGNSGNSGSSAGSKMHIIELKKKGVSTQNSEEGIAVQESSSSSLWYIKDVISFTGVNDWVNSVDLYIDGYNSDDIPEDLTLELLSDTEQAIYLVDPSDTNRSLSKGTLLTNVEEEGQLLIKIYSFDFGTYNVLVIVGILVGIMCVAKEYDDTFPTQSYEYKSGGAAFRLKAPVVNFRCTANSNYTGYISLRDINPLGTYKVYLHCLKTYSYGSWTPDQNPLVITYLDLQQSVPYADKEYWYEITCTPTSLKVRELSESEVSLSTVSTISNENE